MTSQRKADANRRNAMRSTGPRTIAGKTRSRRNALKHGLDVPLNRDDSFSGRIEELTNELISSLAKPQDIARLTAEAQLALMRVQEARIGIINGTLKHQVDITDTASDVAHRAKAIAAALSDLVPLDRYERRALSRLRKVLRNFEKQ